MFSEWLNAVHSHKISVKPQTLFYEPILHTHVISCSMLFFLPTIIID